MTKRPYKLLARTEVKDLPFQIVESTEDLILNEIKKRGYGHAASLKKYTKLSKELVRYWLPRLAEKGLIEDLGVKTILENGSRKQAHLYGVKK